MNCSVRKGLCIFILAAASWAFAQQGPSATISQNGAPGPGQVAVTISDLGDGPGTVVQGEPYSATLTIESVETLADGNRIVQTSTGTIARDSQGRTRRDMTMPPIGNLSAANAPHLVLIEDPVAQAVYALNLTDKTAQKMAMPPRAPGAGGPEVGNAFSMQVRKVAGGPGALQPPMAEGVFLTNEQGAATTEDLGSQTMEGVLVTGVRTTRTIPAGQIGNEKPIRIVTEVWTSPDLQTIVYSTRNDPRMSEQTFKLTNITRSEPDPSLLAVPSDFQVVDGPKPIIYRPNK